MNQYHKEHDIIYFVNDRSFRYYPASLVTILNDLYQELESAQNGESHMMTLSGYTVLEIQFRVGKAIFFDPLRHSLEGRNEPLGEFSAAEIVSEFQSAVNQGLEVALHYS